MKTLALAIGLSLYSFGTFCHAEADDAMQEWQLARLFHPTQDDLQREAEGSVFIYSGLRDKVAERALDEQFDRIESIMFVRTVVTGESAQPVVDSETGEAIVEDDGCSD